jgi:hypothetical protein
LFQDCESRKSYLERETGIEPATLCLGMGCVTYLTNRGRPNMGTSKGWKKMRAGDVTLEQLATCFQVSNRAEGKSPATIRWYDQNIALFVRFLSERG